MTQPDESRDPLPSSPASERNKGPILECLGRLLPASARVLEVASGVGQHVAHFAAALPATRWQPTEADPNLLPVIRARVSQAGLANVCTPVRLDVTGGDWGKWAAAAAALQRVDAVYTANLLHISPWAVTAALFEGAARVLDGAGRVLVYGPFRIDGAHISDSNAAFDASLRARHPDWGIRDLEAVTAAACAAGFTALAPLEMPANNRLLAFDL